MALDDHFHHIKDPHRHGVSPRIPADRAPLVADASTDRGTLVRLSGPFPAILAARDVIGLQRTVGNRTTASILAGRTSILAGRTSLQRLGTPLSAPVRASDPTPIAEAPGAQRRYTPAQYIVMWEKEQGRSLTTAEKDTIARGCIGLVANNLNGGGNPPLDLVFGTFDQAHQVMVEKNRTLDWMAKIPFFGAQLAGNARYVVFAKLFWSNQDVVAAKRAKSDRTAFRPDPKTGRVDMTGYAYREQPGYVNFDYGFWDEASKSFWHANHMDYGDPGDPMIVLQSTQDKFATKVMVGSETRYGYTDFDRVIYGVALANNYDPALAAAAAAKP